MNEMLLPAAFWELHERTVLASLVEFPPDAQLLLDS